MSLFPPDHTEDAVFLSRAESDNLLGTFAPYPIQLEGKEWPTVEHYFQGMKFEDDLRQEQIRTAETPKQARKSGRKRHKSFRKNWHQMRQVIMTRAVYTRCKMYPEIAKALLETGNRKIVENSTYDYFWGCGRDRRGENTYGVVLMNVRQKLRDELEAEQKAP
ncbi:MAG: NADAR family protein [Pseudomonadales bacterium]|nr:NADAR family protein [Pseudomonadales bacterium]